MFSLLSTAPYLKSYIIIVCNSGVYPMYYSYIYKTKKATTYD